MLALASRRALSAVGVACVLLATNCVHTPERLPTLERQFYENLPTEREQREFLRLRKSQRHAYLVDKNLWQQWEALSEVERQGALKRAPAVGFTEFALRMAWGRPADVHEQRARGRTVRFETYIRCTSGPRRDEFVRRSVDCDGTASEVTAALENGRVIELRYLD
ncbi:MAG: hypothetical protein B7733_25375 [Myxococcales bacterium FL481]|nr:MAG: hypothetical protein B7733_25375 [Myxococcales bacterium FL481]